MFNNLSENVISFSSDLSRVKFRRLPDLKVSTQACDIWDILLLSPDSLLLSNWNKGSVQLVDSRTGSTLSEITVPEGPQSLCRIRREHAAVTTYGNTVQLLEVRGGRLTPGTVLGVKGSCWGVTSSGDNVVVSYRCPPWLEVVSKDGSVLHYQESRAAHTFEWPDFLTTSRDGFIFVADRLLYTITKLDSSLKVLQTFSDPQLSAPRGIISVSADQLMVCSWSTNSIVHVNVNSGKMTTIIGGEYGGLSYRSLAYCPQQRKLFVCVDNQTDSIQVYQWE